MKSSLGYSCFVIIATVLALVAEGYLVKWAYRWHRLYVIDSSKALTFTVVFAVLLFIQIFLLTSLFC